MATSRRVRRRPAATFAEQAIALVTESCVGNWLAQAARDDGRRPGSTTTELVELREAKKRIRLLEQENEVLRRAAAYLSQANLPGK